MTTNDAARPVAWRGLWDSQWVNIVNHNECYRGWELEDAVNHAVKLTEKTLKENNASAIAHLQARVEALTGEVERLTERNAELEGLAKYCDLLTHKLITCGVAASHPDAGLSKRGRYAAKWDSPMAQEVRTLRDKADALGKHLVEVEQFRSLARWVMNSAGHGINSSQQRQGEKLMDFINSITQPEADHE